MSIINQVSAGGIVYKKSENLVFYLVCQHSYHKGWVFPKGLVGDKNKNEPLEEAALREVKEEGGIVARIVDPIPVKTNYQYRFQNNIIKKTVYYYLMQYLSGDPKDHDWEMSEAKFLREKEVKKILTYVSDRQAFEKMSAKRL